MKHACARAEILAGAIALGEALDGERDEYRRHIATCASCVRALGGEREIERTMALIGEASASEVWQPVLSPVSQRRSRAWRMIGRYGLPVGALAAAMSWCLHLLLASRVAPVASVVADQPAPLPVFHVSMQHRAASPVTATKPKSIAPRIVVVHNVITLKADRVANRAPTQSTQMTVVAESPPQTVKPDSESTPNASSDVPIWRRDRALPLERAPLAGPRLQGRAESIAVAPIYAIRDVTPLGGDTAINPQPPLIAYAMGAEGTTAFEVTVDEHGTPVKCAITKSSGYLSLDDAVCRAAMKARYAARTVNGRPTMGIYRDAFTFRAQDDGSEGIPRSR